MMSNEPDRLTPDEMMAIAESILGTTSDPDQMPITMGSWNKLQSLSEHCVWYEKDEKGKLISWVVFLPTTKQLACQFAGGEITERELLDQTQPQHRYSALYLCFAITAPEYRRKGHALRLLKETIQYLPLTSDAEWFAWPISPEGERLATAVVRATGKAITLRKAQGSSL